MGHVESTEPIYQTRLGPVSQSLSCNGVEAINADRKFQKLYPKRNRRWTLDRDLITWKKNKKQSAIVRRNMVEAANLNEYRGFLAAPLTFFVVVIFQLLSRWLEQLKKKGSMNARETNLRTEIKQLLKEASALSQPSTFAQAAKLRRSAAAKEKELANFQEQHSKEIKFSYDLFGKVLFFSKAVIYLSLVLWFWRAPIAVVSEQLVQPFGRLLSWGAGGPVKGDVLVGVIPWLILSTRVSKYIGRLVKL